MSNTLSLESLLKNMTGDLHPLVPFDSKKDKVGFLDLSADNKIFTDAVYSDMAQFEQFIDQQLADTGARYLVGGYNERREMYRRSNLFDKNLSEPGNNSDEPRCIHLGIDIWGKAGTPVYVPIGGVVYGFAFNNKFGDYGATIILQHQVDAFTFYTLYGHLSLADIGSLIEGEYFHRGQPFAHFGNKKENGHWPPHLHFQVIQDIGLYISDYPGVCKASEAVYFLSNCPNPHPFIHQFLH